jgi:hypothetical protein
MSANNMLGPQLGPAVSSSSTHLGGGPAGYGQKFTPEQQVILMQQLQKKQQQ